MQRWDIFCRIVDNYGDIGVCWRLARQLAAEYGLEVRLWVDAPAVAARIIGEMNAALPQQIVDDVEIRLWAPDFPETDGSELAAADVVIEAFACDLPPRYLQAMARTRPLWLNLEYLSAESWVAEFHAQPSVHPALGLTKYFFFPGFGAETGGLLREGGLIEARNAFQGSVAAQRDFWQKLGVEHDGPLTVSLFCYPHAAVMSLLDAMAASDVPVLCLVPDGGVLQLVVDFFGESGLKAGARLHKGNLDLQVLPFLSQDNYDRLLWACDLNFVRGEDSWIRALWAARAMIWQPYRQAEQTHLAKLNAFMAHYVEGLDHGLAQALIEAHEHWAEGSWDATQWPSLIQQLPALQAHAERQAARWSALPDLAAKLVIFSKKYF